VRTVARFVRRHWGTIVLLLVLLAGTEYIVRTRRPPGSMTVLEAQAMDMSQTGTPVGSVPVAIEKARLTWFTPSVTYTGTVVAYNDTQVVARTEGWLVEVRAYPGDHVQAGQLLAKLDTRERSARLQEAQEGTAVAFYEREAMQTAVRQAQEELRQMQRQRDAAEAMVQKAQQELISAQQEMEIARTEREEMAAEVDAARTNHAYWQAEDTRAERLLRAGAISLEERQRTQAEAARALAELNQAQLRLNKADLRIKQAHALVQSAQAQYLQAQREAQAMQAGVQRAQAALDTARAQWKRAAAMHRQANAVKQAETIVFGYTRITAPVSGVLTERLVSPGTLVMPGTALFRLQTIDRVRLQVNVAETDVADIRKGSPVIVTLPSDPTFRLNARVTSLFYAANPESRTVTVEAVVSNPGYRLLPGQYVVMEIAKGAARRTITVPLSAVRRDEKGKPFVWVVQPQKLEGKKITYTCVMHPEVQSDKPGKCPKCGMNLVPKERGGKFAAHRVNVVLGDSDGRRVEVRAGIHEGDEVIYRGHEYLKEGDPVSPVEWGVEAPIRLPEPAGEMHEMQHQRPSAKQGTSEAPLPANGKTVYTCSMHPEVRSDKPGDCPKCGMKLEPLQGGHSH
jgi:RND family efflux transporter MFP subunit